MDCSPLTPREALVLHLLAAGGSNKSIAQRLGISRQTVKQHLGEIYAKLGVICRTEAVIVYLFGAEPGYKVELV